MNKLFKKYSNALFLFARNYYFWRYLYEIILKRNLLLILTLYVGVLYSQNVEFTIDNFKDQPKELQAAHLSFEDGIDYYDQGIYKLALIHLLKANTFNPYNSELNYLIGNSYLNTVFKAKALLFLKNSFKLDENYSYKTLYLLGQAYQYNYKFEEAKKAYYQFQIALPKDSLPAWQKIVDKKITECNSGLDIMMNPSSGLIINQKILNSNESDYAPVISSDGQTVYFTSRRLGTTGGEQDKIDSEPYEDVYTSTKKGYSWTKPINMGSPINTKYHDATVGLSSDGNELYIYRGKVNGGDLFVSKKVDGVWTGLKPLSSTINTSYQENSASVSKDNKTLYFISNKPGGKGGKDIYIAKKDEDGNWSNVKNLGDDINTSYDEDGVFISADEQVIYFSSNGHNTMGGHDIFFSQKQKDGSWSKPKNMGYPINSPEDDIFFFVTGDGQMGYYSSVRSGGTGKKSIYAIRFSENDDGSKVYLASNAVFDCRTKCEQQPCVTFNVNYFHDENGEDLKYEWVLGDGSVKYGNVIEHCYKKAGNYHVVVNSITKQGIKTENIESTDIVIEGTVAGMALIDALDYVLINKELELDASQSYHTNGTISRYLWNFENGDTDSLVNINKTFNRIGNQKIELAVLATNPETNLSCYAKATKTVKVFKNEATLKKYLLDKKEKEDFDNNFRNTDAGLYTFKCTVLDSLTNLPILGLNVQAIGENDTILQSGITDQNGELSFLFDNSKNYNLSFIDPDYEDLLYTHSPSQKTEAEYSSQTFRLKLDEGILLFGNILDKTTGDPLQNVNIRIVDLEEGKIIYNSKTDKDGYFDYSIKSNKDSISYELIIQKEGDLQQSELISMNLDDDKALNLNEIIDLNIGNVLAENTNLKPIYFGFDQWEITNRAGKQLDKIIKLIQSNASLSIELSAFTDCQGPADYNMILSQRRAKSSLNYILSKNIDPSRIQTKAFGETLPINNCDCERTSKNRCTKKENRMNRRTEFKIINE